MITATKYELLPHLSAAAMQIASHYLNNDCHMYSKERWTIIGVLEQYLPNSTHKQQLSNCHLRIWYYHILFRTIVKSCPYFVQVEGVCVFEAIRNHRGTAFMVKQLTQEESQVSQQFTTQLTTKQEPTLLPLQVTHPLQI